MSFKHTLLFALFAAVTSASATDVKPVERFGSLIVNVPQEVKGKMALPSIYFSMNGNSSVVTAGTQQKIAAGTGCLTLNTSAGVRVDVIQCGIEIKHEQLTVVNLSGIMLALDKVDVDFGPRPFVKFATGDKDITIKMDGVIAAKVSRDTIVLLPEMNLSLNISHPEIDYTYAQSFQLKAGAINRDTISVTEGRGELRMFMVDGLPKFKPLIFNYILAAYAPLRKVSPATSYAFRSLFNYADGRSQNMDAANYFKFKDSVVEQKVMAFPLKASSNKNAPVYYLAANEHAVEFSLASGQTTTVPVATLNVHSFNTKRFGTFILNSNRDDNARLSPISLRVDRYTEAVRLQEYANESSLFLPFGYKYRFDFFAQDDLGKKSMQDQVEVDLTTVP